MFTIIYDNHYVCKYDLTENQLERVGIRVEKELELELELKCNEM